MHAFPSPSSVHREGRRLSVVKRESMPVINQGVHHSREPFVKGGSSREDTIRQAREDAISRVREDTIHQ